VKLHEGLTLGSDFDDIGAFSEEVFGFSGFREFPVSSSFAVETGTIPRSDSILNVSRRNISNAVSSAIYFVSRLTTRTRFNRLNWLPKKLILSLKANATPQKDRNDTENPSSFHDSEIL
jgi:hypothetical protein